MNGVITIALKEEKYYHWSEILFRSILLHTNIEFALVYDNDIWFKKYNLDKLVKYPIYKTDINNPYLFKYELINYSPFDNTIFLDSDTIIFKDITPLFTAQSFSICAEWDSKYNYNYYNPFVQIPQQFLNNFNLTKFYSAYSGYIRFEKNNFFKILFNNILLSEHHIQKPFKIYGRNVMPDEYFLNIVLSKLTFDKFIPIQLYYITELQEDIYGYSYQGGTYIENKIILNKIQKILTELNLELKINDSTITYKTRLI